ncbi:MAG: ribulose-phosphate 3-epimerase, partial [Nitrososphaerales archaeon]
MIPKIAPSILAGDHGNLSGEATRLQKWGADWIHVDI